MKKIILLPVMILLITPYLAHADEQKDLTVTTDLTYASKWLSKGVEAFGSSGALFKSIDIDFYETGFGLNLIHRNATSSGFVDQQRIDYRPYYKGALFTDSTYLTNYDLSVAYESYTGLSRKKANTTYEWVFAFSWPKLLPHNLTPAYIAHYEYPAFSGQANRKNVGWVHRFLLTYDINTSNLKNPLKLTTEIAYYDGLGNRVSDWAYFTTSLATKFNITKNLSFIPGLYHQITMDDSISENKNITYTMLSAKYKF